MTRTSWPSCGLVTVWLAVAACGELQPAPGTSQPHPVATSILAATPDVSIGVLEGSAAYTLRGVTDAARLEDGAVVVADCSSGQLRYFDADGRFVRAVGGHGSGPGEFTFLRRILRLGGDTLGAYDGFAPRLTIFAPDGRVVRTLSFAKHAPSLLDVLGRFSNGSFVARRVAGAPPDFGVPFRRATSILVFDPTGRPQDSIIGLPGVDAIAPVAGAQATVNLRLHRAAVFAVGPNGVSYGGQDGGGVLELDEKLVPVGVTETITRPQAVTERARRDFEAMQDDEAHMPPDGIVPVLGEEYAPEMPAFGEIIWGRDGRLWVQDPIRPAHYPLIWTAYGDGSPVTRVELPPRFFPFEFGRDWVLGASYDADTVERVELWRIVPGQAPGLVLPPRDAEPPIVSRCGNWASR